MFLFPISTEEEFKGTLEAGYHVIVSVTDKNCVVPEIAAYFYYNKEDNTIVSISFYDNDKTNIDKHEYDLHAIRGDKIKKIPCSKYNYFDFDRIYELFNLLSVYQFYGVYYNPYL